MLNCPRVILISCGFFFSIQVMQSNFFLLKTRKFWKFLLQFGYVIFFMGFYASWICLDVASLKMFFVHIYTIWGVCVVPAFVQGLREGGRKRIRRRRTPLYLYKLCVCVCLFLDIRLRSIAIGWLDTADVD